MPLSSEVKKERISEKMSEVLSLLGLDLSDPSLAKTPQRIAKMFVDEVFSGLDPANFPSLTLHKENFSREIIVVKNISFVSFCEHHFVPMIGKAHIAYFPYQHVLGLSNIPQIVRYFAKRPQLQERLTAQIADTLASTLETEDVAVVIQAMHFCTVARGIEDREVEMETRILKGRFESEPDVFSRLQTT